METVHSFRSIRARTVYLIPLYSIGSPLRAFVLRRRSAQQILPRIVEVSLFKMDHSDIEKGRYRSGQRERRGAATSADMRFFPFRLFGPANVWSYPTFPPAIQSELFDTALEMRPGSK
jgi:hypothetical protein